MTAPAPDRRCGTCKWWKSFTTSDWDTDWGGCEWGQGNQPASMRTEPPEMHMNDGTDCSQWSDGAEALGEGDP